MVYLWYLGIGSFGIYLLFSLPKIPTCLACDAEYSNTNLHNILLYILLLAIIPSAFTINIRSTYGLDFNFRPLSHWLRSPAISVTLLDRHDPYSQRVQKIDFFGYWRYTTFPKWLEEQCLFAPEKEPSTLKYAFALNDKIDFINKFRALLDTQYYKSHHRK